MDLSIIIVNYNAAPFLERCLGSIRDFTKNLECEICVVDNASTDNSREILKNWPEKIQVIINPKNVGFASAMNAAFFVTSGRYCLWLNPDTEIKEGSFETLIKYFETNPGIGILGPQILNHDGSVQLSSRSFPSYQTAFFNRYSLLTRLFPGNPFSRKYLQTDWNHDHVRETDWVSGAVLMHRREAARNVAFLDENFFMYCEDVDFCFRVRRAGWKVAYHPGLKVFHHIGASSRHKPYSMIVERHRSMWFYYGKHFKRNILSDLVVGAAIFARCFFLILTELFCRYIRPKRKREE